MLQEKLQIGVPAVEEIYSVASVLGLDVIKLIWNVRNISSIAKLSGFEVPVPGALQYVDPSLDFDGEADVPMSIGQTLFYVDSNRIRWGYVIATEKNIRMMMNHLSKNWYKIQDRHYRTVVVDLAKKEGLRLTPKKIERLKIHKSDTEIKAEKRAEDSDKELREMRAKYLAALEENDRLKAEEALDKLSSDKSKIKEDRDSEIEARSRVELDGETGKPLSPKTRLKSSGAAGKGKTKK